MDSLKALPPLSRSRFCPLGLAAALICCPAAQAGPLTSTSFRDTTGSYYLRVDDAQFATAQTPLDVGSVWDLNGQVVETTATPRVTTTGQVRHVGPPAGGTHGNDGASPAIGVNLTVTPGIPAATAWLLTRHSASGHTDVYSTQLTRRLAATGSIASYQFVTSAWHVPGPVRTTTTGTAQTFGSPILPAPGSGGGTVLFDQTDDFPLFDIVKTFQVGDAVITTPVTDFRFEFNVTPVAPPTPGAGNIFNATTLDLFLQFDPVIIDDITIDRQILNLATQDVDQGLFDTAVDPNELLFLTADTFYLDLAGNPVLHGVDVFQFALTLDPMREVLSFAIDSRGTLQVPEPAAIGLYIWGIAGVLAIRRQRRSNSHSR